MKKLISSVCVLFAMTMFVSCGSTKVTTENFSEVYEASREAYEEAKITKSTTVETNTSEVAGQSQESTYTTEFTKNKNGDDDYTAASLLTINAETPYTVQFYYDQGYVYADSPSNAETAEKNKFAATYDEFADVYNINLLEINPEDIVSNEITEVDGNQVATLVLSKAGYEEELNEALNNYASMIGLPAQLFTPEFSDINYVVTFDKKGNIINVDNQINLVITISLASMLGDSVDTSAIPDQVVNVGRQQVITLDMSNSNKVALPEDMDAYVDQSAPADQTAPATDDQAATDAPAEEAPAASEEAQK